MIEKLKSIVGEKNLKLNYPLKNCSSFGIGGEASVLAFPTDFDSLFNLVEFASLNSVSYKIIGNASNILFSDKGFKGIIISTKKINGYTSFGDSSFLVSAGVNLGEIVSVTASEGLSGLEYFVGIPGTIGGGIFMNAGANGKELSDIVKSVTFLENGDIRTLQNLDLEFGYRTSYFKTHPNAIIMFAEIELMVETSAVILNRIQEFKEKRKMTQPAKRSAGCVFKKCGDTPAGLLIDKAGLKGKTVGDASVSEVHANFIVNNGNAKSQDVINLIKIVKNEVNNKFGVNLELEIEIVE